MARAIPNHLTPMTSLLSPHLLALLQIRSNPILGPIFMYAAIFAVFYFVLLRPGQKKRKDHDATVRALKKGDEIVTQGGIVGEIVHISQSSAEGATASGEDRITIKSGESRLVVERGLIARVVTATAAPVKGG